MKRLLVLLLVAFVAVAIIGCQSTAQQASTSSTTEKAQDLTPYKIGAIVSATGPSAPLGEPERKTLEMEVEKINADGGINGHKIDLILIDDQSEAKNAAVGATKLIEQDNVTAVIGATISPSSLAIKPETEKAKTPQMAMAAGVTITAAPNTWIFRTAQSDAIAVQKVIDYLSKTLAIKKLAIIHDANAFGVSGSTILQKSAPGAGLSVTSVQSYKTEDTDMTAQLTQIKGTSPEVIVVWGTNPGPAIIAKNMKQLNIAVPYVGSHGIANKTFITLAGAAAEGVVFPAGKILVPSAATGDQATVINNYLAAYQAKYNEPTNSFGGHAYDAIHILANALKEAGDDKAKLRDAIENTKDLVGITGMFNYGADNHDGTTTDSMIMVEIKDGKWIEKK